MATGGNPIPLTFLLFLLISLTSSKPLQLQTLIPTPLSTSPVVVSPSVSASETQAQTTYDLPNGFRNDENTLTLHHIDTLISTNAPTTPRQLLALRLRRDAARVEALTRVGSNTTRHGTDFSSSVISGLAQGSGEYFTRIGIGTPPKFAYMVLDTGSDVVWIQCAPCKKCYTQADPVFDPSKSTSYRTIGCDAPVCRRLDSPGCSSVKNTCMYQVSYGDGSFTFGELSSETLSFRKTRVTGVAFGCGHDNEGLFVGAAGLLGLGRGKLSFPNQTGRRFNSKFSYCLVDRTGSTKTSSLMFGDHSVSVRSVFTPLLTNPKLDTFYYVGLTGISVGGKKVDGITASLFKIDGTGNGGVIIDSGTSVTRLTRPAYVALRDAFRIGAADLKRAPNFSLFDTCYDLSGKTEVKVPTVVMHFVGADVALPASNYLIPVDSGGSFCFAFAGTNSRLSIIGNIQQQGIRVVYDLAGSRVGFAPGGCV